MKLISIILVIIFVSCDAQMDVIQSNTFENQSDISDISITNIGTESLIEGSNQSIQWSTESNISYVRIELYRASSPNGNYVFYNTIDSYEYNDGTYSWNIPSSYTSYSYYYKIRISDYNDSSVYGESNYFQINGASEINVTTPSSNGTIWSPSENQSIQWSTESNISYVRIQLYRASSPNGNYVFYNTIDSNEYNDGTYSWNISSSYASDSYYYKIRISDYYDSSIYGESNYFQINETPNINVTTPSSNGTIWSPSENQSIQWSADGNISYVRIQLYRASSPNGIYSTYNTLTSYTYNDGIYNWNIPSSYTSYFYYYKIRISDYNDSSVYGESNYFQIY